MAHKNAEMPVTSPSENNDLSRFQMLAIVIREMPDHDTKTFTLEDLVVAAWRKFPMHFCLAGFPQYPDKNKVRAVVWGGKGLVARGMLRETQWYNEYQKP